jgi:hypothetical protein
MPRKLTILGVLAALVLGVVGLTQGATATPIQSFCSAGSAGAHGGCTNGLLPVHSFFCLDNTNGAGAPASPVGPIPANGIIPCGTDTSNSAIPAGTGSPIKTWQVLTIPFGARQSLPAYYLPADWGYATALTGATVGDVSSNTDLLCDSTGPGGNIDILSNAGLAGNPANWPGGTWTGFPFIHQNLGSAVAGADGVTPGSASGTGSLNNYVDSIKPMPSTFTDFSLDRSNLLLLWLSGNFPFPIPPTAADGVNAANQGTPLQNLVTNSPYVAGMHVSVALLAGDPAPPTQAFLCLDSPQNSVALGTTLIPPSTPGNYVRWTALQSAADTIDGTVSRILDVQCINVGGAAGTCDMSDVDGDLVPAAVEAVNSTNPAAFDSDADGASDFDEIFQFTNPNNPDTDGDGSADKQDDLAGFNCAWSAGACTVANLGDTTADDNCPVDANPLQENTDSQVDFTNSPNVPAGAIFRGDATNPHQDHQGDVCDADADNDGLNNVVEAGFQHPSVSPGGAGGPAAGTLYCLNLSAAAPAGGSNTAVTDPLNPDTDSDGGLDGRECLFGSDPISAAAGSCQPTCASTDRFPAMVGDTDSDKIAGTVLGANTAAEAFFRTQHIALPVSTLLPAGAILNDLEQVGSYGAPSPAVVCVDLNAAVVCDNKVGNGDNDSDGDLLNDGVEVKWYATSPANFDTDGDGCSDGREAADVNGNHKVDSTDLLAVAQHGATGSLAPGKVGVPLPLGSPNPAYTVAGVRRADVATYDVNKDGKIDSTDLLIVAKASGNCLAGIGAQTAKPILNASFP